MSIFDAMLAPIYAALGVVVTHLPAAGGASTSFRAVLDQPGAEVLGGEMITVQYELRYPASSLPHAVRGDAFVVGATRYIAKEDPLPLAAGSELVVPLRRAQA